MLKECWDRRSWLSRCAFEGGDRSLKPCNCGFRLPLSWPGHLFQGRLPSESVVRPITRSVDHLDPIEFGAGCDVLPSEPLDQHANQPLSDDDRVSSQEEQADGLAADSDREQYDQTFDASENSLSITCKEWEKSRCWGAAKLQRQDQSEWYDRWADHVELRLDNSQSFKEYQKSLTIT